MSIYQADISIASTSLLDIFKKNSDEKAYKWLTDKIQLLQSDFEPKDLYLAFNMAPRFVRKNQLVLNALDLEKANQIRKGLSLHNWTSEEAARILLILAISKQSKDLFIKSVLMLFETADVGEFLALYSAFPLLPYPEELEFKQAEGVRSNMTSVFERIAFYNPYTLEYLNNDSWNQMVIKAIFVDKNINNIYGLDSRRNLKLSQIARDLAHERWAAGRPVRPELWRLVVPFVDEQILSDLEKLLKSKLEYEQLAGLLLAKESGHAKALSIVSRYADIETKAEDLTWDVLAEKYQFSVW